MEYLVKEEELIKHLVREYKELLDINYLKNVIKVFLKSKQPVELLAEGEFSDDWIIEDDKLVMGSDFTRKIYDLGFEGKQVKLFVQEVSK